MPVVSKNVIHQSRPTPAVSRHREIFGEIGKIIVVVVATYRQKKIANSAKNVSFKGLLCFFCCCCCCCCIQITYPVFLEEEVTIASFGHLVTHI